MRARRMTLGTALAVVAAGLVAGCAARWRADWAMEHFVGGQLAMEREDYQSALEELTRAVRLDPRLGVARSAMGDLYRRHGDYRAAADAYEVACRLDPYAFRPHYNLGVTYQVLAGAAATAQAAAEYMFKAVQIYLRAVTIRPEDFDTNLNLAACYFQQGKHALAEQYCRLAIGIDEKNPYVYSNLGIIYDAQGRGEDAIRAYKQSLEIETRQPKLLLNLGATYLRLGRTKEALNAFRLSAEQDPASSAPWEQIGTCHFRQKKYPEALEAYAKALEIDPVSAAAYRGMGVVQMTEFILDPARTDRRDRALEAWERSLELDPNQPDLVRLVSKYAPNHAPEHAAPEM